MKRDDDWFNHPHSLRERAKEFDARAYACAAENDDNGASGWQGKARALRARAGAIERANGGGDPS